MNGITGFCVAHYSNAHYLILRTNSFAAIPGRVSYSDYLIWHGGDDIATVDTTLIDDLKMFDAPIQTYWHWTQDKDSGDPATVSVNFKVFICITNVFWVNPCF